MPFIAPDDHILIMDFDDNDLSLMKGPCITSEEAKQLYDCGIRTAVKYVQWNLIEPERGRYEWDELDRSVRKWTDVGIKVLLSTYQTAISWAPDNWYAKNRHGAILRSAVSVFNMEAQTYSNQFIHQVVHRYPQDMVCAFNAQLTNGETVYHNEPAYYDDCGIADYATRFGSTNSNYNNPDSAEVDIWLKEVYISTLLKQHYEFTQTPHKEIWTALHPIIRGWTHLKCNGNKYFHDIFKSFKTNFPDSLIYQILYTYFPHGEHGMRIAVDDANAIGGIKIWAGSEYAEGLLSNTEKLIQYGLRGFLTAPIHPFTSHRSMELWMYDAIRNTNARLSSA